MRIRVGNRSEFTAALFEEILGMHFEAAQHCSSRKIFLKTFRLFSVRQVVTARVKFKNVDARLGDAVED
jgi:hypothetical protein